MVISIGSAGPPSASAVSQPKSNNASRSNGRHFITCMVIAGGGIALTKSINARRHRAGSLRLSTNNTRKLRLSNLAVDAICGAVGEVASLVALYPLDTIKVQCQARGASAAAIMKDLARLPPGIAMRSLYAGVGSAAIGAGLVGSLYLVAFFAAKRVGTEIAERRGMQGSDALIASSSGVAASLVGSLLESPIEHFKVRTQAGAGAAGEPMLVSLTKAAAQQGFGHLYYSFLPFLLKSIPHDVSELVTFSSLNDLRRNSLASTTISNTNLDTASTSSSSTSNSVSRSSSSAVSSAQPSTLAGWQHHAGAALARLPESAGDMLIGAAAGAAAAAASMPCDVIFTQMNLNSACVVAGHRGRPSLFESASLFLKTGQTIVRQGGGHGALFVGIVPRLMQTVPAGVVYWMAVESTRRALRARFDVEEEGEKKAYSQLASPHSGVADLPRQQAQDLGLASTESATPMIADSSSCLAV